MTRARLAIAFPVLSAMLMVTGVVAVTGVPDGVEGADAGSFALLGFLVPVAAFAGVGAVLGLRRPENPIGWLLATVGLIFALVMASSTVAVWGLETGSLSNPVGGWISVLSNTWVLGLGLIGIHIPLRLPDGRLPSPRWRWFSRITIVLIAISFVGMSVQPGEIQAVDGSSNPIGSETLKPIAAVFLLVILAFIGGVAALVQRYRRSGPREREQLRWVAFSGLIFLIVYVVTLLIGASVDEDSTTGEAITTVSQMAFAARPIGIGYAILRQGLYDIDAVISRTLSYGALTATLGAAYLGCVLLLQLVLSPSSDFAVAGSTLAVAALFRPARTRIQSVVDRRFNRHRYDAQRTLESFGSRLRDEVDLDALGVQLRTVVAETMQPQHVSVWVRPR